MRTLKRELGIVCAVLFACSAFAARSGGELTRAPFPPAPPQGGERAYCASAALPPAPCGGLPGCYSVAIVADTQHLVDGLPARWEDGGTFAEEREQSEYKAFQSIVAWLLARQAPERIAFALHVGDAIESGSYGQPLQVACVQPREVCVDTREDVRLDPKTLCRCGRQKLTKIEWQRFDAEWQRLDGVLPYAIVRGNHDTAGALPGQGGPWPARDPYGFAQHFGEERVRALPGWASTHLQREPPDEFHLHSRRGYSHAFRFALGPYTVGLLALVNDFARNPLDAASLADVRWLTEVMAGPLAGLPLITLSHYFVDPSDAQQTQDAYRVSALRDPERVFMAVQGHLLELQEIRDRDRLTSRDDAYPLLFVGSQGWPVWPPLLLVRFHFKTAAAHERGLKDEVEVLRVPDPGALAHPESWQRKVCADFDIFYRK